MRDWTRKRGDRHPPLSATLSRTTDGTSVEADITTASSVSAIFKCTVVTANDADTPDPLIEGCTVVDASSGSVRYDLSAAFALLPAGIYKLEFEALYPNGTRETFPDGGYLEGEILADLGDG